MIMRSRDFMRIAFSKSIKTKLQHTSRNRISLLFSCTMSINIHFSLLLVCMVVVGNVLEGSAEKVSTTVAPNTGNVSTPTTASATTKPSVTCEQRNSSCGSCSDDSKCYWCSADSTCKVYPTSKIIPRDCKGNKWFWKQCLVPGYVLIIVIPSLCGVLLIAFGCCIYCCCCRSKGSKEDREEARIRRRKEEANERNAQRRADRQKRSDAIRQKYGLLNNEDDNEVV